MDSRTLSCFILLGIGYCNGADVMVPDNIAAKISGEDQTYTAKLSSCTLKSNILIPGPMNFDCYGMTTSSSIKGPVGQTGMNGLPGLQGSKGEKGEKGDPGEKGKPGVDGLEGKEGERGVPGQDGKNGPRGERGSIGPSGSPGLDGTCLAICNLEPKGSDEDLVPEGEATLGTKENPSNTLCNAIQGSKVENKLTGDVWMNASDKFQVRCDETTHRTCLILHKTEEDIEKTATNYKNDSQPFWLSGKSFDLRKFYHNITMKQISWLLQRSSQVVQRIRYHCKNSHVADKPETSLRLYGWNEVVIARDPTEWNPLAYSIPPETHQCTQEAPKTEWRHSDIIIKSKTSRRLPVIDFYIADTREEEDQSVYLELLELCFG